MGKFWSCHYLYIQTTAGSNQTHDSDHRIMIDSSRPKVAVDEFRIRTTVRHLPSMDDPRYSGVAW